jgi:hypothetical protein
MADEKTTLERIEAALRFLVGKGRMYVCDGVINDEGRDAINGILDGTRDANGEPR